MRYWKKIESFNKTYGRTTLAFGPFNFKSRIVLLLGKNGTGKTTCLKCLAGLMPTDKGVMRNGMQYVSGGAALPLNLRAREYLDAALGMSSDTGRSRLERLIGQFDLASFLKAPIKECSDGMKQRLALAGALIHDEEAILFDEPLRSLDGTYRRRLVEWIVQSQGRFVIATHEPDAFKDLDYEAVHL